MADHDRGNKLEAGEAAKSSRLMHSQSIAKSRHHRNCLKEIWTQRNRGHRLHCHKLYLLYHKLFRLWKTETVQPHDLVLPEYEDVDLDLDLDVYQRFNDRLRGHLNDPELCFNSAISHNIVQEPFDVPLYCAMNSLSHEELAKLDEKFSMNTDDMQYRLDSIDTIPSSDLFQFDRLISLRTSDEMTSNKQLETKFDTLFNNQVEVSTGTPSSSSKSFVTRSLPLVMETASDQSVCTSNGLVRFDRYAHLIMYNTKGNEENVDTASLPIHARLRMELFKQFGTLKLQDNVELGSISQCMDCPTSLISILIPVPLPLTRLPILKHKLNDNRALESQLAKCDDTVGVDQFIESLNQSEIYRMGNISSIALWRKRQIESYNRFMNEED